MCRLTSKNLFELIDKIASTNVTINSKFISFDIEDLFSSYLASETKTDMPNNTNQLRLLLAKIFMDKIKNFMKTFILLISLC